MSSAGWAASEQSGRMGYYLMMAGVTRHNRPVWKKEADTSDGAQFLFYDDNNYWMAGPDYTGNIGGVLSVDENLLSPPLYGWRYWNSTGWVEDPQLKVQATMLNCGNHVAQSCSECPQGNGEVWCNADCHCFCHWEDDQCKLKPASGRQQVQNGQKKTEAVGAVGPVEGSTRPSWDDAGEHRYLAQLRPAILTTLTMCLTMSHMQQ